MRAQFRSRRKVGLPSDLGGRLPCLGLGLLSLLVSAGGVQAQFGYQKPKMVLSPASVSLGLVKRDTWSAPQQLRISNTGTAPLVIDDIRPLSPYFYVYDPSVNPGEPLTVPPGQYRTIKVEALGVYAADTLPGSDGRKYVSSELEIRSNASVAPRRVPIDMTLTGAYLVSSPEAAPGDRSIVHDFGSQPTGTDSEAFTLVLTNIGDQDADVGMPTFPGGPEDQLWSVVPHNPDWNGVLAPGQSEILYFSVYYGGQGHLYTTCYIGVRDYDLPFPDDWFHGKGRFIELHAFGE